MKPRIKLLERPRRVSLRTSLALIAALGLYLACWKATREHERNLLPRMYWDWTVVQTRVPLPFVIVNTEVEMRFLTGAERRYYLWFFGQRKHLVHSSTLDPMLYTPDFPELPAKLPRPDSVSDGAP